MKESIQNLVININELSPFSFVDDMEVMDINFIHYSNYLYYKIINKNNNKINYGILDIKTNQILYNFDAEIFSIFTYSTGDILALTSNSLFKICVIKGGDSCIDVCDSNNLLLDTNGNKCQNKCDVDKIKLK